MLTERNRAVLHRRLSEVVGDEEAVSEMLSNFPNDERLRPATESFVDSALAQTEARLEARIETRIAQQTTQIVIWMVGTAIALAALTLTAIGMWA